MRHLAPPRFHERAGTGQRDVPPEHEPPRRSGRVTKRLPHRGKFPAMTAGTTRLEHIAPRSGRAAPRVGTVRLGAAPNGAGAAVGATALPSMSDPLPAAAGVQPHLAGALRAAAAARAVAARIRATVARGSTPSVPEQGGGAAAADGPTWRGVLVAEAAAATRIAFRPLRRPFDRLPHGAPQSDLKPIAVAAIDHEPPRREPPDASAKSEAGMPHRAARTIAELERLRRAAGRQREQPQPLLMSARA